MNDMDIYFTTDLCDDTEVRMSKTSFITLLQSEQKRREEAKDKERTIFGMNTVSNENCHRYTK